MERYREIGKLTEGRERQIEREKERVVERDSKRETRNKESK